MRFIKRASVPVLFFAALLTYHIYHVSGTVVWWLADDPQILRHVLQYTWWETLIHPAVWMNYTAHNFTPGLLISHRISYALFGLTPFPFYLHQWVVQFLTLLLLYRLLRIWLPVSASLFAVTCFTLTRPMIEMTDGLMIRHYLEGLAFALLTTVFFHRSTSDRRVLLPASLFYALACASKEIFVLWPFALILLPGAPFAQRLRQSVPLFAITVLYLVWRWHMLGALGGYGHPPRWEALALLPLNSLSHMGLPAPWNALVLAAAVISIARYATTPWRWFALVSFGVTLAPLTSVATVMTGRYTLLPAMLVALWSGWLGSVGMRPTSGTGHRMLIYALLIAMLPMLWYHNRGDTLRAERSASERIRAEGQFILHDGDATDVLIHPAAPGWYYQGLDWIRTHLDPASPAPRYLFDPISLLLNGVNDDAVFHQFDPATRSIQRAHAYREELQRLSALLHMDTPLVYEVSREGSKLTWCLGPWTNGVYTFIVEENFRYPVPPSGYRNIRHDQDFVFRIKYELPDEWFTYSPKYVLPASLSRSVIVWPLPTQPQ